MNSPGHAFQECTGSCHSLEAVSSKLRLTDGLTVLPRIEIVAILIHYQLFTHTMKPSDPLMLPDVPLRGGMYPAGKIDISRPLAI